MLDDTDFTPEASEIVKSYVKAGGEAVGPDLDRRLREQIMFWRADAPSLSEGWRNEMPIREDLRDRYLLTLALVVALQQVHYFEAQYTAVQLRELWQSFPNLNDRDLGGQLTGECDLLIDHLRNK